MDNREQFLDILFAEGARQKLNDMRNKTFKYTILDKNFMPTDESGVCEVINRRYDHQIDCDVITIRDIDTGKMISRNQFRITLETLEKC